jgi:hypothetical protein
MLSSANKNCSCLLTTAQRQHRWASSGDARRLAQLVRQRTDGKGLDPCKPIHLSQSFSRRIESTSETCVSLMSRAEIFILGVSDLTKSQ